MKLFLLTGESIVYHVANNYSNDLGIFVKRMEQLKVSFENEVGDVKDNVKWSLINESKWRSVLIYCEVSNNWQPTEKTIVIDQIIEQEFHTIKSMLGDKKSPVSNLSNPHELFYKIPKNR